MKTKEMLDQPLATSLIGLAGFSICWAFSTSKTESIEFARFYLVLRVRRPFRTASKRLRELFLVREGYASAIRSCRCAAASGSGRAVRERSWRPNRVPLRFPSSGSAARIPAVPVKAKSTGPRDLAIKRMPAKLRPLTDVRLALSQETEEAKPNSPGYVCKERRQLQLRLRGKFASMFAASF